jgi:hypothetical protein
VDRGIADCSFFFSSMAATLPATRKRVGELTRNGTIERALGRAVLKRMREDSAAKNAIESALAAFAGGRPDGAAALVAALRAVCPGVGVTGTTGNVMPPSVGTIAAAAGGAAAGGAAAGGAAVEFTSLFASIKIEPNDEEEDANSNFPRNLHNAVELFVVTGQTSAGARLSSATSAMLKIYSEPSDMTNYAMGRACVCWACGHAGLPANRDELSETDVGAAVYRSGRAAPPARKRAGPAPECGACDSSSATNFLTVLRATGGGSATAIPWIQRKEGTGALDGMKAQLRAGAGVGAVGGSEADAS